MTGTRLASRTAVLLVSLTLLVAISCSTTSSSSGSVGQGLGSNDASGDVTLGTCKSGFGGIVTCKLTILNHSEKTSDYFIEAEVDDASGANVGTANAMAQHVGAGQTAKAELTGFVSGNGKNVTVKITQVQRTASI